MKAGKRWEIFHVTKLVRNFHANIDPLLPFFPRIRERILMKSVFRAGAPIDPLISCKQHGERR